MTYRIEFTPDRMTVTADLATDADMAALVRAVETVAPLIGAGADRPEEITRELRQAKALRALAAAKEIRPEPQEPAEIETDEAAERIDPRPPPEAERVEPVATLPGRVEKPVADRHEETGERDAAGRRGPRTVDAAEVARRETIVRELYPDASISTAEIGRRAGVPQPQVSVYAKRLGLPPRGRPGSLGQRIPGADEEDDHDGHPPEPPAAPAPAPATNGHVFTLHGVSLTHDAISFNGKEMPITESQYRLLHALLRAAPHPIGVPHLLTKVYPGKAKTEAEVVFGIVVKDMERNLPMVDLSLKSMKGIGVALSGSDAG